MMLIKSALWILSNETIYMLFSQLSLIIRFYSVGVMVYIHNCVSPYQTAFVLFNYMLTSLEHCGAASLVNSRIQQDVIKCAILGNFGSPHTF